MNLQTIIQDGALGPAAMWRVEGAGALVCFEGIVRPIEAEQPIAGLRYETYDPMAERELQQLAAQAIRDFGLLDVRVEHSRGFVANGDCSFRLRLAAVHRQEALAAMDWFIDRMKRDVPIWKRPVLVADPSSATI